MRQCRPTGISRRFIMVTVGDLIGGVGNDSFDDLCMACTKGCRGRTGLCDGPGLDLESRKFPQVVGPGLEAST
jgi:hypothetical protein